MAKAVIYSDEDVLAAQQALRNKTARKVGKTRSQVAEFLADDIRKVIEQGYSLKDIKNILAESLDSRFHRKSSFAPLLNGLHSLMRVE
ncbi:MAG: hypothetical protein IJB53_02625 [Mailhella sp.]|nr:hypothetical protein [Mailhella sp.]